MSGEFGDFRKSVECFNLKLHTHFTLTTVHLLRRSACASRLASSLKYTIDME